MLEHLDFLHVFSKNVDMKWGVFFLATMNTTSGFKGSSFNHFKFSA